MRIFFLGDVFGKGGSKAVRYLLPKIVDHEYVDLTIANVENVSGGIGVSREAIKDLKEAGVQVMTSGNHVWKKPGVEELFKTEPFLLRPANYPPANPGKGSVVWESHSGTKVGIINLLGRVFMDPMDCPFRIGEALVHQLSQEGVRIVIVDFHAEATSEKVAFGWFMDGNAGITNSGYRGNATAPARKKHTRIPRR